MLKKLLVLFFVLISLKADDISTYLVGDYEDVESVKSKLSGSGFEVVATYPLDKDGVSVVFTSDELKKEAAKKDRGFMGVLRVYIDKKENTISFTNPVYFGKAFMQDDYKEDIFKSLQEKIKAKFKNLKDSKEELDDGDIKEYHFMFGMPYYTDFEEVAKGSTNELLAKAKAHSPVFVLKISDEKYLVGFDLKPETKGFVQKIGRKNGDVLPYVISIEDNKAKILHPKFYIALSYPKLSMGKFMTISNIPGDIIDEAEVIFK